MALRMMLIVGVLLMAAMTVNAGGPMPETTELDNAILSGLLRHIDAEYDVILSRTWGPPERRGSHLQMDIRADIEAVVTAAAAEEIGKAYERLVGGPHSEEALIELFRAKLDAMYAADDRLVDLYFKRNREPAQITMEGHVFRDESELRWYERWLELSLPAYAPATSLVLVTAISCYDQGIHTHVFVGKYADGELEILGSKVLPTVVFGSVTPMVPETTELDNAILAKVLEHVDDRYGAVLSTTGIDSTDESRREKLKDEVRWFLNDRLFELIPDDLAEMDEAARIELIEELLRGRDAVNGIAGRIVDLLFKRNREPARITMAGHALTDIRRFRRDELWLLLSLPAYDPESGYFVVAVCGETSRGFCYGFFIGAYTDGELEVLGKRLSFGIVD